MRRLALLLALASSGCTLRHNPLPLRRLCADGLPLKILQDPRCRDGICGYTCAPDRWAKADAITARGSDTYHKPSAEQKRGSLWK